ncbi:hypothetical protein V3470_10455 [Flavobacterium oreochromis]|uniref:Uncharacterized protein n=1 Tax=Flavobacterium oreochromis TaxID=2906078 RepID=A0ABW8PAC5_9FLAO|nr:hypothetical protein [Flavobacterium oreochromis]OWP74394.1 hypothetical protein BWG23_14045 [Flavobacterium oreochromis]
MKNDLLHTGIDILNECYPTVTTAFLTESISNYNNLDSVQILIINEIYDYFSLEYFEYKGYDVEIIILPKSILLFTEKHIDFIQENDLFDKISKGIIIKDTNSTGEKLQQMYEVINSSLLLLSNPINTYKKVFDLSKIINKIGSTKDHLKRFLLKNEIVYKTSVLIKHHKNCTDQIIKLQDNFTDDDAFLNQAKLILESLGGSVTYYSENDILNNPIENEFSILMESSFTYDDFITLFLIHFLKKIKGITHKIKFIFKVVNDNQFLITIWTENELIKSHIIPALNQIFISNVQLYNSLKPKYPYCYRKQQINDLLIDNSKFKELQLKFSDYILDLKLNDDEELTEGYRLSLGVFFTIEIVQILFKDKIEVKKATNLLFEEWLAMSYDTTKTNWNDLEIQSHKTLNDLENLYLAQLDTLLSNFGELLKNWQYKDESGLGLDKYILSIYYSFNTNSIFNYGLRNKTSDTFNDSLQIILYEILNILGIKNFNKLYIIYAINRILHEA